MQNRLQPWGRRDTKKGIGKVPYGIKLVKVIIITSHLHRDLSPSARPFKHGLFVYTPVKYTACVTTQTAVLHIAYL